jgi:hypothetical protein
MACPLLPTVTSVEVCGRSLMYTVAFSDSVFRSLVVNGVLLLAPNDRDGRTPPAGVNHISIPIEMEDDSGGSSQSLTDSPGYNVGASIV